MTQKSLFTPIAARFGFVFIDQYGVLHDGQRPYPGAIEALATLKAREARVVILSNSGRSPHTMHADWRTLALPRTYTITSSPPAMSPNARSRTARSASPSDAAPDA